MKSKNNRFSFVLLCFVFVKIHGGSEDLRYIRLENFKNNYLGKTIQFLTPYNSYTEGVLLDVTINEFIILTNGKEERFQHKNVNTVYLLPRKTEFFLASSFALFGGAVGYLTLLITKENSTSQHMRSFTSLGLILGGLLGKNTFYKPLKVDISGKVYE